MFDRIYKRILNSTGEAELLHILRGRDIDEKSTQFPYLTIAGKLASEGQHQKVELLRRNQASVYEIVKGYTILQEVNGEKIRAYLDTGLISMVEMDRAFREIFKSKPVDVYTQEGHFPDADGAQALQALSSYYDQITDDESQVYWSNPPQETESPIPDSLTKDRKARDYAYSNNHKMVEKYRLQYHASPGAIANGYALVGSHSKVEEYRTQHGAAVIEIIPAYVQTGNHEKVEEYRIQGAISADDIAQVYAFAGNHEKVEKYRIQFHASASAIAQIYAYKGCHDKVEEYRHWYGALSNEIVQGYIEAKNHAKIEEYRSCQLVSVDSIAYFYARAGNHVMVDKYLGEYQASIASILEGYLYAGNHEIVNKFANCVRSSNPDQYKGIINTITFIYTQFGNHEKVEEYRARHNVSVINIAKYYVLANNHEKLEEYRTRHGVPIKYIVQWYAHSNDHKKVEEYRIRHAASVKRIVYAYARVANHAKVNEYLLQHKVSLKPIIHGYIHSRNHEMVKKYLNNYGNLVVEHIVQCYRDMGDETRANEYSRAAASSRKSARLTLFPPAPVSPDNTEDTHAHGKKSRKS